MIAKIVKSQYGGIMVGDKGEVVEQTSTGFAVRLDERYIKLFGGAAKTRTGIFHFTPDEIEIIPDNVPIHEPKTS